jgi:serine/threonine protein kinase/Tfp pilus assembly protein PilF
MLSQTANLRSLEEYIEAFESARSRDDDVELSDYLPERQDPAYKGALTELIRVDMEFGWREGKPRRLEDYRALYPEAFADEEALRAVAFEEYRQRRQAGESPSPAEYQKRFGISIGFWPRPDKGASDTPLALPPGKSARAEKAAAPTQPPRSPDESFRADSLVEAAAAYRHFREGGPNASIDSWCASVDGSIAANLFRDVHRYDPKAAERLARAVKTMPEVGTHFLGFHLVEELGRGAFGRVFLAHQGDLANRPVALKIATNIFGESQTLAQLQHTNIVPIYSTHRADPFQAVCMPYYGGTTLAHVLQTLEDKKTIPASGKDLVSTINDRKHSTRTGRQSSHRASSQPRQEPIASATDSAVSSGITPAPVLDDAPHVDLKYLEGLSYVDAVLWIGSRLADGLTHAHDRGVLHRDLKPANILLTDEGQPMLLDFNLSEDTKHRLAGSAASIGGTLPYMAPEHLEAFGDGKRPVDARSDIYSLGIILFELLTRRHPFPIHRGATKEILPLLIADRVKALPKLRRYNRAVSPAVESIVRHCLEPDPARRYQTARELHEDLERQQKSLPLKHAPEPSFRERLRKWGRRHPVLTSWGTMTAFALLAMAGLAGAVAASVERLRHLEDMESFHRFRAEFQDAQLMLYERTGSDEKVEEGLRECRKALDRYQVLGNPAWDELPQFRRLPEDKRDHLRDDLGELLLMSARATTLRAQPPQVREFARDALHLNDLALACFGQQQAPKAVWQQRADLVAVLGDDQEADRLKKKADSTPDRTARDYYLSAHLHYKNGNYRKALPLLEEATHQDPQNFPAWFTKAMCHFSLVQYQDAVACFGVCVALRPEVAPAWYNRGLGHLEQRHWKQAVADFNSAITLKADMADAYIARALAYEGLEKYRESIADFTKAIDVGAARTRVYFMRAVVRRKAGDKEGAQRDRDEGLRRKPTDDVSWIARGLERLEQDPKVALADFDEALKVNPLSFAALQNKAHVLGEWLHRDEDAVAVLDKSIGLYPDSHLPRAGRGVHLARLGKRTAAHADAQAALLQDTQARNLYQVGCIYALTAKEHPEDRFRAFELLSLGLKAGFGLDIVDKDSDLDPLRKYPEFKRLVDAARALQSGRADEP